ncbi:ABC transporter substrate-binding protein [Mycetocola zhujimingii]|uniref:ABC transporter substrate-binding protein n=1 Tax=Mycetocola zhujimingii TaxID=2079792 RepID=UPI000D379AD7|nr:extracellular solute-binding protein [Mycetocola zhujimingii]AWB87346.1 ABC transporter substrate-binding protein [Mycetocola zhujimingii]
MMITLTTRSRRMLAVTAGAGIAALVLSGCGGGGGGASSSPDKFGVLINAENTEIPDVLAVLADKQCSTENETLPIDFESVPQTNLDQRLQLLAGQNALPVLFSAGNAPALTKTLAESGNVLDFEKALTDLDALDNIEPAAISTIESLYGGFNALPFEYNVEGIWYNKQLFADNGVTAPETWDDLVSAAETFNAAGLTPFSASGDQGWPITRLIGNYIFRTLGPDALQKVADGDAKLTDPEYVEAAQAIADLGAAGYFGQGVGSIDADTAANQFMNGSAAMYYMGSWTLSDFADAERNQIGEENIGFMPFPSVEGGEGDSSQLAANVGLPATFNAKSYDENVGSWLSCISENYGSTALADKQRVSGFKLNTPVEDVPPLTAEVQERISATDETVLWFEALFSTKATTTSQTNAAQLVTGDISAEEFMSLVQNDL